MLVAVLGAGYAGLTLANRLEDALPDDEIVVVDEDATHLVQHELHRVVRHPSLADDITLDLDDALDRTAVREATVTDVDPEAGVATLDGAGGKAAVDYDAAAVCLGATTNYYDLPGVREHATPLKRLEHAHAIRAGFLNALDAGTGADPASVVVGGAGLSGIQVAGELAALAVEETGSEAPDAVEVVLLEQMANVAPAFPENFQRAVREELEARDVTVRTGTAVERADAEGIDLADGERLGYDQFVWTGGIRGPAPLGGERPTVGNTLRLGDATFVVGDAGRVVDTDGEAVPASAQAAVGQARVAAENIEHLLDHDRAGASGFEPRLQRYRFESPGWLVSVGDGAVAQVGPTVLTGRPAKLAKTAVGAGYLSSVGAVENAVDLVREELGWPGEKTSEGGDEEEPGDEHGAEPGDGPVRITLDDETERRNGSDDEDG